MPSALPVGDPVPADGSFPETVRRRLPQRAQVPLGLYVHIPFCSVRCGYCDFNTYTSSDLGPGASHSTYADTLISELEFAASALKDAGAPPRKLSTVFFGGGTPTLLPAEDLGKILHTARDLFGFAEGAEITTEANPDTVTPRSAETLAAAGFTRVSLGMQSDVPEVLQTLDRTHDRANVPAAHTAARDAGLQTSLDLIYGTPGETLAQWRRSLEAAVALAPDHISAYSLIVEEGTAMAAAIRRGALPDIDPDDQADKYVLADELLHQAGYTWYEVSNFSTRTATRSRHNLHYWQDTDWWGAGPGAHSHLAGVRWWNVKHPAAYAQRLHQGFSPGQGREILDPEAEALEHLMLHLRIAEGLDVDAYHGLEHIRSGAGAPVRWFTVSQLAREGLIDPAAASAQAGADHDLATGVRLVLTLKGRLLADAVTRRLAQ